MAKEKPLERGVTTETEKGTFIPPDERVPYAPENLHMSKAQFIEAQNKRRERTLKLKEYESQLKQEQDTATRKASAESTSEKKITKKKTARKKKK